MKRIKMLLVCACSALVLLTMLSGTLGFIIQGEGNRSYLIIYIILITAVAIGLSVYLTTAILRKIRWYESMLDAIPFPISVTDMNMNWTFINKPVEQMLNLQRSDVVGKKCSNWNADICNTSNCGINCLRNNKELTYFSQMGMDFQVNINYLFEHGKKIGHIEVVQDISKMTKVQKEQAELIDNISDVSASFLSSSHEVAEGSQVLAKGNAEQSSAVYELNTSINEISEKTKHNAVMAKEAADLSGVIRGNAEKGNAQMKQMTEAVEDINTASNSIGKVMKVIDDIAFQTNILALNAAVEAARAGQHGKGFAVVAEEVRSLAAKSAEAAKDTESLISDSIEKAKLGTQIAVETASSLGKIVEDIIKSDEIIDKIAHSSNEQDEAIERINRGIEQVSQVLQQNNATAQESAAASQEMTGQAIVLQEMVDKFNNENNNKKSKSVNLIEMN